MRDLILNKYELMWMMVLFDLPVIEKKERKDACEKYYRMIHDNLPMKGKVDIITITDRQYGNIISYNAGEKRQKKQPEQFLLF